ncbi:hypothetical protein WJX74_009600 [Apatococcus lobatus]|uniref:Aquaporin n=1 Tax=Apatococcus lobatus TaxID=904363 RepID=A0AAW1SG85_9CHLO
MGSKLPITLLEKDFRLPEFLRALLAELIGTAFFIFFSTATVTSGCHTKDVANQSGNAGDTTLTNVVPGSCFLSSTTALLNIALAFGFSLFVVIYFTASFSGGHINPAVTIAFVASNKVSVLRGACYIIMQLGGAAVASGVLKGLDPTGFKAAAGAANQLNPSTGVAPGEGIGYEIVMSFAFIFVIFAATDSTRMTSAVPLPILAPFSIGMTLFVAHLIMIPIDGCCLNPARSFGPAVLSRTFHQYWIFWVGPIVGGLAAAIIYGLAFREFNIRKSNRNDQATDGDWNPVSSSPAGVDIEGGKPPTHVP